MWILEARSKRCVENDIFWSEIRSGFRRPGDTPPPGIPRSTSRVHTAVLCPVIRAYFQGRIKASKAACFSS